MKKKNNDLPLDDSDNIFERDRQEFYQRLNDNLDKKCKLRERYENGELSYEEFINELEKQFPTEDYDLKDIFHNIIDG